jgi:hypothetical protein
MIPETTREAILDAMRRFDHELRNTPEWSNWEQKANYRYAITYEGRYYPVKQIIAMATGTPVNRFSRGVNRYISNKGFSVISLYNGNAAEMLDIDVIQGSIESILSRYIAARSGEPFGKSHQIWSLFEGLQRALSSSDPLRKRPSVKVTWSAGKGNWANIPWMALVDTRDQSAPRGGIYLSFLFRQDMSGVYLALMQGHTDVKKELGKTEGLKFLRSRAGAFRKQCAGLTGYGFALDDKIDLCSDSEFAKDHEAAAIAYKFYEANEVPDDSELLQDVDAALQVYTDSLINKSTDQSFGIEEEQESNEEVSPENLTEIYEASTAIQSLINTISETGFIFEPWQIAAYVAALRTKPFIILAGVSGTGKSKLPKIVAGATGGQSYLIPVRPDWTDSSDVLGYLDLQGHFRPGPLLELARKATEEPEKHFVCIVDEMNLARVEHYFAEILSRIEDRFLSPRGGFESEPLLPHTDTAWAAQGLPPNLAIVGTVNMDESAHGFSRKVLDRAFTLELSDVDLKNWETGVTSNMPAAIRWPVSAWQPRAIQLSRLAIINDKEREIVNHAVEVLSEVNRFLVQAQLQLGYRTRDEVALFVLHANEFASSFVSRAGEKIDPLDLALKMKVLPRIAGGSNTIRLALLQFLGWSYNRKPMQVEEADRIVDSWRSAGCPGSLTGAQYPRTAARLCLMWDRLQNEGFTSFWL